MSDASTPQGRGPRRLTNRQRKILAVVGSAAVIGVGVSASLAAWTDNEWVYGGSGSGNAAGVSTSTFHVQQNTDPAVGAGNWVDHPGSALDGTKGQLVFTTGALDMSPGTTVYAPIALKTTNPSLGGTIADVSAATEQSGATVNDSAGLLFSALQIAIASSEAQGACDASAFNGSNPAWTTRTIGGTLASTAQIPLNLPLAANGGSTEYFCFRVSLPDPLVPATGTTALDYMGLSVAPAWQFETHS